jgi:EAL domain-containing protein (putative c-di-GMP-specific phosphodiesterase class I)
MAARSPALKPVAAAPPPVDSGPATVESLGRQLRDVLPTRRLHSLSLCDHEANVLWLSEGALGPDEHSLVVEALELLSADTSLPCHEMGLEDGRLALFLPVRAPTGALVGIAMILADGKAVGEDTLERMAAGPVRAVLLRLAVLLKPQDSRPAAGRVEPISAEKVDEILEFELSAEDTGHVPVLKAPPELAPLPGEEMAHLEFIPGEPTTPAAAMEASAVRTTTPQPSALPAAAPAPTPPADRAPVAVPASDQNLLLEVVPFAKLRTGGQLRRFQILARMSQPLRDPAAQDVLVLQRLMSWLAAHRTAWNSQPTGFTVNLSIATLEDERFAQKIAAALNSQGIAAETLGFEIAEALCTQRRAQVERFIGQCEKVGAWVVIDGFSFDSQALPLLRSKALRLVKIDPKLTSAALKDKLSQAMVVAAVQAAKVLGIHCAAQKVDSQASLQWLTAIGCDFAQGAVLGRTQALESVATLPDSTDVTAHLRSST